ncbi:MAG: hypothetical protein U9P73_07630 [Candidatus Cloacimonadota bacterium]|nr:hypothetical protein [Candidatus Cloacimonadota bacterium]
MKKTLIFFIAICFMVGLLNSEPVSFRNIALGKIIDDDLDLVNDPIELKFVEGSRLYTNLSNIVNSNEEFLANNSSDTFLIGYSTKNPFIENLWNAVFIEFQKTKIPHSVWIDSDLDGNNDISGFGLLSDEFTGYYDLNGDGIYDILRQISQERSDYDEINQVEFALNNTYDTGNFIIGAKFHYSSYSSDEDITYDLNYTYHDIEENFDYYTENQLDDSNNHYLNSNFDFQASMLLPDLNGYEVRGDFKFMNQSFSSNTQINDYYREDDYDPDILDLEDYIIIEEVNKNIIERPGNAFTLGTSIRKTFVKADQRKNDGYWKIGGDITFGSYDYSDLNEQTLTYTEKYFDGLDTLFTDYLEIDTENALINDDGTQNTTQFSLIGKLNYPFNEKVYFGLGLNYNYQILKRETDFEESIEDTYEYEIIDEESTVADFVTTQSYSITADRTIEQYSSIFSVPVGIEYKFTNNNKWDIRFGSVFRSSCVTVNDAKEIKDATPLTTETVYGDGSVDINIDDNTYESTSEQTISTNSSTNYYYGLGFRPTDNLQIDLLGFLGDPGDEDDLLDADFYKQLRLSFTLKF